MEWINPKIDKESVIVYPPCLVIARSASDEGCGGAPPSIPPFYGERLQGGVPPHFMGVRLRTFAALAMTK